MNIEVKNKNSEKGEAGIKLVIVLIALFLIGHAGYNYIPIAYEGEHFKQEMHTAVVQGMVVPNGITPVNMVKSKIQRAIISNNIPSDAIVQVKPTKDSVSAHVAYTKQVSLLPFGLIKYNYQFDHTATPAGFLLKN
jgi:hypothetical protein